MLAQLIEKEFQLPRKLLEELIGSIEYSVKSTFPQIRYLYLAIHKKNPPIGMHAMASEVILEKNYDV